jgi:hypothetical protein
VMARNMIARVLEDEPVRQLGRRTIAPSRARIAESLG